MNTFRWSAAALALTSAMTGCASHDPVEVADPQATSPSASASASRNTAPRDPPPASSHCRIPPQPCGCSEEAWASQGPSSADGGINACQYLDQLCRTESYLSLYDQRQDLLSVPGRCDDVVTVGFDELDDGPLTEVSVDGVRLVFRSDRAGCTPRIESRPDGGKSLVACSAVLGDLAVDLQSVHDDIVHVGVTFDRPAAHGQVVVRAYFGKRREVPMSLWAESPMIETPDLYTAVTSFDGSAETGFVGLASVMLDGIGQLRIGSAMACTEDPPAPAPISISGLVLCRR